MQTYDMECRFYDNVQLVLHHAWDSYNSTRAAALVAQQPLLSHTTVPSLFSNLWVRLVVGRVVALGAPRFKRRTSHL